MSEDRKQQQRKNLVHGLEEADNIETELDRRDVTEDAKRAETAAAKLAQRPETD